MTLRGLGVGGVVIGSMLALMAYLIAWIAAEPAVAAWMMIAAIAVSMPAALLLGGRNADKQPWLAAAATMLCVLLSVTLAGALVLPPDAAGTSLVLGLPRRLALVVYGVGVLPFLFLPLAFAMDYRGDDLDPQALERLRDECDALRRADR